jgi:hypothetical protein
MSDSADDGADEVKVFRKNDTEDLGTDSLQSSVQLHEDKQDVAFEAEMETQPPINGQKPNLPFSFPGMPPISPVVSWMSPYASPAYFAAAVMSPQYHMYNALMQMRNLASFNQNQNNSNGQMPSFDIKPTTSSASHGSNAHGAGGPISTPKRKKISHKKEESHIKKPLNAFMWFMKENRQKVLNVDGNASKQSAELNTILGKMWHDLPKDEQQKYYEKAKEERENHQKLYPNWSARENYAVHKKKRKKRERSVENLESKKCRARFGVNNQEQWCKHCKRKKRCLLVRDSESPHNGGGSSSTQTNPTTPHMLGSPSSAFGSISRPSSTISSDEEDVKDIKDVKLIKPIPSQLSEGIGMPQIPNIMNFAAMSPSFPMFNFHSFPTGAFPSMMQHQPPPPPSTHHHSTASAFTNSISSTNSPQQQKFTPTLQSLN